MQQREITRDELKARLDNGDDFHLIMVLGDMAYRAKHIPGSENIADEKQIKDKYGPDSDIVVYCSSKYCSASAIAYRMLHDAGYKNLRRYVGGLLDWEEAGLPLEGELVDS